ncbi:hypothetical protein SprV_0501855900 [Sparganum proliferum]
MLQITCERSPPICTSEQVPEVVPDGHMWKGLPTGKHCINSNIPKLPTLDGLDGRQIDKAASLTVDNGGHQ